MTIIEAAEKYLRDACLMDTDWSYQEITAFARHLGTKYILLDKDALIPGEVIRCEAEAPKSTECKHDGMFKKCPLCQLDNLTGDMRKVIKHINE